MMNSTSRRRLRADDWCSARDARELVFCFIRWGEHEKHYLRGLPDIEVETLLAASSRVPCPMFRGSRDRRREVRLAQFSAVRADTALRCDC